MKIYAEFPITGDRATIPLIWPDSCWLLSDRPLYIPDFAPEFVAIPALACKVGRLGKCVAPRFASRYAGSWTAALIILPESALQLLSEGVMPRCSEWCFDNSLVIGDWQAEPLRSLDISVEPADKWVPAGLSVLTESASAALMQSLCNLSEHNTLKMGDLILVPLPVPPIPLAEGMNVAIRAMDYQQAPDSPSETIPATLSSGAPSSSSSSSSSSRLILTTRFK